MATGNLDKIVACSFKSALRLLDCYRSCKWERVEGLVTGHSVHDPIWLGCPTVELHYKFYAEGRSTKGCDAIPFLWLQDAKSYAGSFPHNLPVTIRVNPLKPQQTHFFERDQTG